MVFFEKNGNITALKIQSIQILKSLNPWVSRSCTQKFKGFIRDQPFHCNRRTVSTTFVYSIFPVQSGKKKKKKIYLTYLRIDLAYFCLLRSWIVFTFSGLLLFLTVGGISEQNKLNWTLKKKHTYRNFYIFSFLQFLKSINGKLCCVHSI